jgi:2-polyprenyl-6-methoxyphenol hydroxylase-like FAD-dependent oxidoreductase
VGAGIGGMSAALNLLRAGFDVQVYEQARTLREGGAGINVQPNATRIIHDLGLGEKLERTSVGQLYPERLPQGDICSAANCSLFDHLVGAQQ